MQGLRQRILAAASETEVAKLVEEGKTYEFSSRQTRNSWKSAARRALKQAAPEPVEEVADEPVKKARKKKK